LARLEFLINNGDDIYDEISNESFKYQLLRSFSKLKKIKTYLR